MRTLSSRRAKLDLYTAGITTNFVLAAVSFLLFSTVLLGGMSSPYDDNCAVYQSVVGYPEDNLPAGAIITDINGSPIKFDTNYYTVTEFNSTYGWLPGGRYDVGYTMSDGPQTPMNIIWGLYISKTVDGSPVSDLSGTWVRSIKLNGIAYTFCTAQGFTNFMSITAPNDVVDIEYTSDGVNFYTKSDVTLLAKGSIGYLGVYTSTSGMGLLTPRTVLDMGTNPLYGSDSILNAGTAMLSYIAMPVRGFDPIPASLHWWYGDQGDGFWILVHALYWIFWLDLMLGVTNALPAFPFDGGYTFLGWMDALLERLGIKDAEGRRRRAEELSKNVSTLMLFMFMLVILAAII